jgi:hypothetical protein
MEQVIDWANAFAAEHLHSNAAIKAGPSVKR